MTNAGDILNYLRFLPVIQVNVANNVSCFQFLVTPPHFLKIKLLINDDVKTKLLGTLDPFT